MQILSSLATRGETMYDNGNSTAADVFDYKNGQLQKVAMVASITGLTIPAPPTTATFYMTLKLTQDATGGRTIAWPSSVKWGAAGAPTLSAASKVDWVTLWSDDGGTTWYGSYSLGY
jgi:hypothetical protein